jgi:lyso-ornithine lipid O-acyltransferase
LEKISRLSVSTHPTAVRSTSATAADSWLESARQYSRTSVRLCGLAAIIGTTAVLLILDRLRCCGYRARALRLQAASRAILRVMRIHYTTSGHPPDGTVITSNHLSYLDVLVLSAVTPVVFVAKHEVRGWPAIGLIAALAGTRFINRAERRDVARVVRELAPVLGEGVSVVLFLEGTSTDGHVVRPFKSSLLEPAAAHRWPVVPAALVYDVPSGHSAEREVCWWGDMTLPSHLRNLASLPWVRARVNWGAPLTGSTDRKILARAAHSRVTELHRELRTPGVPATV